MMCLRWLLVFIAALKGCDACRFDTTVALVWFTAGFAVAAHERYGCWAFALLTFGSVVLELPRMAANHVVFFGWVALILAFSSDHATRLLLLRVQLCVVYFFAGLSKINPKYLSGQVIAERSDYLPYPQFLAFASIAAEWALCVAVALNLRVALPFAVLFHTMLVACWTVDFLGHGPGIFTFNLMIAAAVAVATRSFRSTSRTDEQALVSRASLVAPALSPGREARNGK